MKSGRGRSNRGAAMVEVSGVMVVFLAVLGAVYVISNEVKKADLVSTVSASMMGLQGASVPVLLNMEGTTVLRSVPEVQAELQDFAADLRANAREVSDFCSLAYVRRPADCVTNEPPDLYAAADHTGSIVDVGGWCGQERIDAVERIVSASLRGDCSGIQAIVASVPTNLEVPVNVFGINPTSSKPAQASSYGDTGGLIPFEH